MSPEWLFGVWQGVDLIEVGSCGENGTFNDTAGICACTEMQGDYILYAQTKYDILPSILITVIS